MTNTFYKVVSLGLFYVIVTAGSMSLTGRKDFLNDLNLRNFASIRLILILLLALFLAFLARLTFVLLNQTLYNDQYYTKNAASVAAAITALSYIGILAFNVFFLGEKVTVNIVIGFFLITSGCFICML